MATRKKIPLIPSDASIAITAGKTLTVTLDATVENTNTGDNATNTSSAPASHNLLSTTHGDTLADTVVRGDIMYGNATPKWARLAFPATPTGKVLIATATDVAWSANALGTGAYATIGDYAPLESPTFTGTPSLPTGTTATTQSANDNSTKVATTAYVDVQRKQQMMGTTQRVLLLANTTNYISTYSSTSAGVYDGYVFSMGGTIKNLYVYSDGAPGVGQTYTMTFMDNNSAQTVTCQISGNASNAANDTTHSFTVSAGERITLRTVLSATATTSAFLFAFEFDPT